VAADNAHSQQLAVLSTAQCTNETAGAAWLHQVTGVRTELKLDINVFTQRQPFCTLGPAF